MINPINPNKIPSATTERGTPVDEAKGRKAGGGTAGGGTTTNAVPQGNVEIDKASTLYRHANIQPGEGGSIDTAETARDLVTNLAEQFQSNALAALIAHGGITSNMGALLEAAPG